MLEAVRTAFENNRIVWRQHALARMLERDITRHDVFAAVQNGKVIEFYPETKPYPGCLISGTCCQKTLHVVVSWDKNASAAYVITVYIPDEDHFEEDGETRKRKERI